MFGWIHESLRQLVNRKYGHDVWLKILDLAGFKEGTESEISHYYKDEETLRLANAMATVIGIPVEDVWEAYGGFLIQYTMESGWDELLRSLAFDLEGFLNSLDSLHYFVDHVVYKTKLKGPSFRCDPLPDGSLLLHYYSKRSGLYNIVKGVTREVARRIFNIDIAVKLQERKQEHIDSYITEHVTFLVTILDDISTSATSLCLSVAGPDFSMFTESIQDGLFQLKDFCRVFPFHICFNKDLSIEHYGPIQRTSFLHVYDI
ncbi:hypothetical protein AB6A40_010303 [Gnathostoma spinigerum]|uniref:Heme NO-binding domain-containing protein n=1 Tax=Gnathostoma spinigerum TaxID=75299 RepID=A0ABD6EUE3_9BILA